MKRIVLAAALLLAAVTAPAAAAERVVLQLRWDHQYQFAGYYAALWQGYYEEAGLEVEIRPAVVAPDGAPLTAVDEVASGRAEFGVGGADILLARDRGEPLVVLASIFQQSAAELYALLDTELFSPADLTRLRILRRPGDLIDIELQAVLRAEGIDPEAIGSAPRPAAGEGWRELVEGRIDVLPGYRISAPYFARRAGVALRRLRPAAYGVSFYGDSLFTHERVTGRDAGLVQRFTAASRRGWAYALEHAEEVADRITAELPRTLPIDDFAAFNRFQIQPVREVTLYPTVEPGHVNPERWRRMHELLARAGLVTRPLDLAGFVFDPAFRERERLRRLQRYLIAAALLLAATASVAWIATLRHSLNRRTATIRSQAADLAAANARLRAEIAERGRAERQRRLVTAEVDHRAKNMLAAVQAMAHQTRHGSPSLDAFAESFEGRIAAMARAHDLLSRGRWEGVGLRALVAEELAPYHAAGDDRVEVDGEDLLLPPKAALSLGMALHELATNAAKYGALSAPAGRVRVAWTVEGEGEAPEGTLALHWRETGGPPVTPPERRGFGSTVIGRSLAYELDGSAEMDFAPGGVRCTIRLPLRRRAAATAPAAGAARAAAPRAPAAVPGGGPDARLDGKRILIAEDSYVVAAEVAATLAGLGCDVAGPFTRIDDALRAARTERLDGAVLDVNLGDEMIFPVADELARRGVPVILGTGYDSSAVLPPAYRSLPAIRKPYGPGDLERLARRVFAGAGPRPEPGDAPAGTA